MSFKNIPTSLATPVLLNHHTPAGSYFGPMVRAFTTTATLDMVRSAVPMLVGRRTRFRNIGCQVTVLGSVGSTCRLGVYNNLGDDGLVPGQLGNYPGARLLDAGVVATGAGAAGIKNIAIDITLAEGTYWVVAHCVTVGGTNPTFRVIGNDALAMIPWSGYTISGTSIPAVMMGPRETALADVALPDPYPTVARVGSGLNFINVFLEANPLGL